MESTQPVHTAAPPRPASRAHRAGMTSPRQRMIAAALLSLVLAGGGCSGGRDSPPGQDLPSPSNDPAAATASLIALSTDARDDSTTVILGNLDPSLLPEPGFFHWPTFSQDGETFSYHLDRQVVRTELATMERTVTTRCPPTACDVSSDGERVVWSTSARPQLMVRDLGSDEVSALTIETESPAIPRWSPDGRQIAVISNSGLAVLRSDGTGDARQIADFDGFGILAQVSWSPDGHKLAFTAPRRTAGVKTAFTLATIDADGSNRLDLRELGRCACLGMAPPQVAWSPDGDLLAFTTVDSGRVPGGIWTVGADGGAAQRLGSSAYRVNLVWRPSATP